MTEAHKLGRELGKRAAINSKKVAYLDSKLQVKLSHNFTGDYIEKFVFSNGKVDIYDKDGTAIKESKPEVKSKPSSKLSNASNEKPS